MRCDSTSGRILTAARRASRRHTSALRFATFEELLDIAPAADSEWLTPAEQSEFSRLRHPSRRASWRSGRLLAKRLLLEAAAGSVESLREVEILSRGPDGRSVRPEVRIGGDRVPWCLSVAHSDRAALAAVALEPTTRIGVDLVRIEAVRPGFLETWFTEHERRWLAPESPERVAACWGIKEAVYKACQQGEGFAPHRIEIGPNRLRPIPRAAAASQQPLSVSAQRLQVRYRGVDLTQNASVTCRRLAGHVAVLVTLKTS
jgi:4'-phosphopantetheinyl transferase EntD